MSKFWQKIWQNVIITDIWLWARCWGISGPGVAPLPGLWHPWSKRFLDQGCPSSITLFCLIFSPQPSTTDPVSAEQCIKMREKEKQERQNSISSGWNTFTTQELTTGSKQKKHTGLFLNIRTLLWPWATQRFSVSHTCCDEQTNDPRVWLITSRGIQSTQMEPNWTGFTRKKTHIQYDTEGGTWSENASVLCMVVGLLSVWLLNCCVLMLSHAHE